MEKIVSGLRESVNPNMDTKRKTGDVVMYKNEHVTEILKNLGENES